MTNASSELVLIDANGFNQEIPCLLSQSFAIKLQRPRRNDSGRLIARSSKLQISIIT
ncbi:hypothetical protein ACSS6W_006718 [Trichoderma asperelloides]